jgi:hypothetical protein
MLAEPHSCSYTEALQLRPRHILTHRKQPLTRLKAPRPLKHTLVTVYQLPQLRMLLTEATCAQVATSNQSTPANTRQGTLTLSNARLLRSTSCRSCACCPNSASFCPLAARSSCCSRCRFCCVCCADASLKDAAATAGGSGCKHLIDAAFE